MQQSRLSTAMNRGSVGGGVGGQSRMQNSSRPIGTATRLMTGMAGQRGSGAGTGVALNAQVNVTDRPMTQQGLGGMRTAGVSRGPQRQVLDKTYFMGLLRTKNNELSQEIQNLRAATRIANEDQSTYLSYEKKAELLSNEIKKNQNEMSDYNTLVDKLTTDENINDIQMDYEDLRQQNDKTAHSLDALFDQRKQREVAIQNLDFELAQEKTMRDSLVSNMEPRQRMLYMEMQESNDRLLKQLETGQQEVDKLNMKKRELEEELAASPVKQEAVRQYEALNNMQEKRDLLVEEQKQRGTPQEERERLLGQVKDDNQEIASMERQTNEIREKIQSFTDELEHLNMDIEENQGERNQKYKELRKREETMNEFLDTFDESVKNEMEGIEHHEKMIGSILSTLSRNCKREGDLSTSEAAQPKTQALSQMREDLQTKTTELDKSKSTTSGIIAEHEKLHQDLVKVEQLESKITQELAMLREKIQKMTSELDLYEDLENLRTAGERKKRELGEAKIILHKRRETFRFTTTNMLATQEAIKALLAENETYAQLGNLERKWQHHEQNNFVMKEFCASKETECNYRTVAGKVSKRIQTYNVDLIAKMGIIQQQPTY